MITSRAGTAADVLVYENPQPDVLVHEHPQPNVLVYDLPLGPLQISWGGVLVTGSDWVAYAGITNALTGKDINAEGWRSRVIAGFGGYGYERSRAVQGGSQTTRYRGYHTFSSFLLGYQQQRGDVTLKTFGGLAIANHAVSPLDPHNRAVGYAFGAAGALEAWWNITPGVWLDANVAVSTIHRSFNVDARLGYRVLENASIGIEVGVVGNRDYGAHRVAGFTRVEFDDVDVRLSVGRSADHGGAARPFGTLNFAVKF